MAHVIGTKMLVRDYNEFGVLELTTGRTEWMKSERKNGHRVYHLGDVHSSSPREVFETVARHASVVER